MFLTQPDKPLLATPTAIQMYSREVILSCWQLLRQKADEYDGLDHLQVFVDDTKAEALWIMDDRQSGSVTALLPSDQNAATNRATEGGYSQSLIPVQPPTERNVQLETPLSPKLRALKDRWFNEPLGIQFPSLGVEITNPTTCAEYVGSQRVLTADEPANLNHFGSADPRAVLAGLAGLFDAAIAGQVDPKLLKSCACVLDVMHTDSAALAQHYGPNSKNRDDTLHASHAADAKATEQSLLVLSELAAELGITLPVRNRGQ